jgi:hypothetical protein
MTAIIFKGWKVGMRGVPFTLLLYEKANVSLKKAKEIKERIVNNEEIRLELPDYTVAKEIVARATDFGIICELQ